MPLSRLGQGKRRPSFLYQRRAAELHPSGGEQSPERRVTILFSSRVVRSFLYAASGKTSVRAISSYSFPFRQDDHLHDGLLIGPPEVAALIMSAMCIQQQLYSPAAPRRAPVVDISCVKTAAYTPSQMSAQSVSLDFLVAVNIILDSQTPQKQSMLISAMAICAHALYELNNSERTEARLLIRLGLRHYEGLTIANGMIKRQTTADYVDEFLETQLIGWDGVAAMGQSSTFVVPMLQASQGERLLVPAVCL